MAGPSDTPPILSRLPEAPQRFLARIVEHGFACGLRFPEEFLRRFGPQELMTGLAEHPTRRARILEATVGLRPRVAMRKSPQSAAEDLQIALDEGETNPAAILDLFEPDDRVLFLDNRRLWAYVVEPAFWSEPDKLGDRVAPVREHTAFALSTALEEQLLTPAELVNAIGVGTLIGCLPEGEVAAIVERALLEGRGGAAFTDDILLDAIGMATLVEKVPLAALWEWVIGAKVAAAHGLVGEVDNLFDEAEAHPDASSKPPDAPFPEDPDTIELAASE